MQEVLVLALGAGIKEICGKIFVHIQAKYTLPVSSYRTSSIPVPVARKRELKRGTPSAMHTSY